MASIFTSPAYSLFIIHVIADIIPSVTDKAKQTPLTEIILKVEMRMLKMVMVETAGPAGLCGLCTFDIHNHWTCEFNIDKEHQVTINLQF